jgi:hypothetical protein
VKSDKRTLHFVNLSYEITAEVLRERIIESGIQPRDVLAAKPGQFIVNCWTVQDASTLLGRFNNVPFEGRTLYVKFPAEIRTENAFCTYRQGFAAAKNEMGK